MKLVATNGERKMTGYNTLTVVSVVRKGNTVKTPYVTDAFIRLGPVLVAKATLGGRWKQPQILAEFKRNPKRFTMAEGYEAAKALGLAA